MTERAGKPPALEWITGAIGAAIFCALMAVLIATGFGGSDAPPSIQVITERVERTEAGYVLVFTARNDGEQTAADVEIVAELNASGVTEERGARFDYLPPRSERRGGLFFENDPRGGQLTLRAEGYNDP